MNDKATQWRDMHNRMQARRSLRLTCNPNITEPCKGGIINTSKIISPRARLLFGCIVCPYAALVPLLHTVMRILPVRGYFMAGRKFSYIV